MIGPGIELSLHEDQNGYSETKNRLDFTILISKTASLREAGRIVSVWIEQNLFLMLEPYS